MGIIFGVLGFLVPLFIIAAAVAVAIFVLRNKGEKFTLDLKLVYTVYFKLMTFVAIISILSGISLLVKSGLSYLIDKDFSYRPEIRYEYMENEKEKPTVIYEDQKDIQEKDIIRGISLISVTIVVLLIHVLVGLIARVYEKNKNTALIDTAYNVVCLIIFGLISLISLPISIYQTMQYILLEKDLESMDIPGESLSIAISFVPIWLYFLIKFVFRIKHFKENIKEESVN